jgi:hypothetical protein
MAGTITNIIANTITDHHKMALPYRPGSAVLCIR